MRTTLPTHRLLHRGGHQGHRHAAATHGVAHLGLRGSLVTPHLHWRAGKGGHVGGWPLVVHLVSHLPWGIHCLRKQNIPLNQNLKTCNMNKMYHILRLKIFY